VSQSPQMVEMTDFGLNAPISMFADHAPATEGLNTAETGLW